jgi:hypothetical protein
MQYMYKHLLTSPATFLRKSRMMSTLSGLPGKQQQQQRRAAYGLGALLLAAGALGLGASSQERPAESAAAGAAGGRQSSVERLELIERSLLRMEQKLDRVELRRPRGMPIDVVLGAQW